MADDVNHLHWNWRPIDSECMGLYIGLCNNYKLQEMRTQRHFPASTVDDDDDDDERHAEYNKQRK